MAAFFLPFDLKKAVMSEKKTAYALLMLAFCLVMAYLLPYHVYPFMAFYNDWLALFGIVLVIAFLCTEETAAIRVPGICVIPVD
jgi:peptidoglycan/LPS O-acetylase OafA/YrhL